MDLGVLEGQTSRGLFSNSIFNPSMIGASVNLYIVAQTYTAEMSIAAEVSQCTDDA